MPSSCKTDDIGSSRAMPPFEVGDAVRTKVVESRTPPVRFAGARSLAPYTAPNSLAALRTSVQNCRTTADGSPRRDARLSTAFGCALPLMRR